MAARDVRPSTNVVFATSHEIEGLSENDFIIAVKLDQLLA
jgi:pterin-4a-carbinolamine dehydratase